MDDSRSVLQLPADLSSSGQFQPSLSTKNDFSCKVCGGAACTVEWHPATEGGYMAAIASLRAYQSFVRLSNDGSCEVRSCDSCAAIAERAFNQVRERLMSELLFASRDLAKIQLRRSLRGLRHEPMCSECRTPQGDGSFLNHLERCRTGRVMNLIEAIVRLSPASGGERGIAAPAVADQAKGGAL